MNKLFRSIAFISFLAFFSIKNYGAFFPISALLQMPISEPSFPFPEIPVALQTPDARKDFLLHHYWSRFDFMNEKLIEDKAMSEQGLVNFLALLLDDSTSEDLKKEALHQYTLQMSQSSFARKYFMDLTSKYLYDVNSPIHNESLYALYLRELLACETLDVAERRRCEFFLKLVERNNTGYIATNFRFITPDNRQKTLLNMSVKGNHLLIIFYDPECEQCCDLLSTMKQDDWLLSQVASGRITVLAIYTEGDERVWRANLSDISSAWIIGYDHGRIKEQALYDLKAMPSLYLLDGHKQIILKDASYEEIKAYLISE